jgi:uncharacterized protein (DUF2141 family)
MRVRPLSAALLLLGPLLLGLAAAPARAGDLRVVVDGVRAPTGTLLVGVYDSKESYARALARAEKDGFQNDPERVAGLAFRVRGGSHTTALIPDLPPGTYGVIVFQDENGNGRLDKNFWGVPTEPYGFSNDALGTLGPPSFAEVAIALDGADRTIEISLVTHRIALGEAKPE